MASQFDPEIDLAGAIIRQAYIDYIQALRAKHFKQNSFYFKSKKNDNAIKECERFFQGSDFATLSLGKIEAGAIMKRAKEEVRKLIALEEKVRELDTDQLKEFSKAIKKELTRRNRYNEGGGNETKE